MKFSIILTSAFFALFIFNATTTFAHTTNLTTSDKKEVKDKEDVDNTIIIAGRTAEVTDQEAITVPETYIMEVKVMKGLSVVAQATGNQRTLTLDLSDLEPGGYFFQIQTPSGIQRKLVRID